MLHLPKNGISNIEFLANVNYVRNLHSIFALFLTASIASGPRSDFFFLLLLGISLCVISYHIISCHVILNCVISYQIILYLFHIISYPTSHLVCQLSVVWTACSDC